MKENFKQILFTKDQIVNRINDLAKEINEYYKDQNNILVVPIMDGSIVFAGHIITELNFDLDVRATKISSYGKNTKSNQKPSIKIAVDMSEVKDRKILILEDLIDQGHTLKLFKKYLLDMGAKEIKICVLFNKEIKNINDREIIPDWIGFNIPDEWVAGFGVDSKSKFRNCPFFGIVNLNKK